MNIVWKRPDGGVSITHLSKEAVSPEHEAEKLKSRGDIPSDYILVGYRMEIPTDRTFRNAWTHNGHKFDHDMNKCREIHKNKLREARTPKLAALDIEYQKADEDGNTAKKKEIADKKKALRDITVRPEIESAQTPEELKQFWPDELK